MEDDLEDHQGGRSGGRRGLSRSQKSQTSGGFYTRHLGKRELKSHFNLIILAKAQRRKGIALISSPPRWTGRLIFSFLRCKGEEGLCSLSSGGFAAWRLCETNYFFSRSMPAAGRYLVLISMSNVQRRMKNEEVLGLSADRQVLRTNNQSKRYQLIPKSKNER